MTLITLALGLLLSTLEPSNSSSEIQQTEQQALQSQGEGCDFIIVDDTDM